MRLTPTYGRSPSRRWSHERRLARGNARVKVGARLSRRRRLALYGGEAPTTRVQPRRSEGSPPGEARSSSRCQPYAFHRYRSVQRPLPLRSALAVSPLRHTPLRTLACQQGGSAREGGGWRGDAQPHPQEVKTVTRLLECLANQGFGTRRPQRDRCSPCGGRERPSSLWCALKGACCCSQGACC